MTHFNLLSDLYLEANILLGVVWVLWIAAKKVVLVLGVESTKQKQLLIVRLLLIFLFVSPVMARCLPSVSFDSLRMQRESIEEVMRAPISQAILSFNFTTYRTTDLSYPSDSLLPLSRIPGFSLQQVKWHHIFFLFLSAGFLIQSIRLLRQIIKLRQLIHNSFLWKKIGKIHILISDETWVPFSTRVFGKNQIVLPAALLAISRNLRVALAHEGQHLRNGDLLWEILMEATKLICYWNPAAYLWKTELDRLREFACDEALIGRHQISSYDYGNCLLQVAESLSAPQFLFAGTASMGLRSFFHRNDVSQLKRRIQMIETPKKIRFSRLKAGILGGMLMLISVLLAMAVPHEASADKKKVTGTVKTASRLAKTWIGITDSPTMGDLKVWHSVLNSTDPDWNNAHFFSFYYNVTPDEKKGYGAITHPNGDQTIIEMETRRTETGENKARFVEISGIFLKGTGKFEGIRARWKRKISLYPYKKGERINTFMVEYF